ncbi:acyl-coenzyme A diphosphatase NUDT19 [Ambystoma mexicanum]|uniref:acyl-coenzyme A diphosphatase NUDT19 n=1 Tax=Ambystoma mexicanum TaxID=8296 RepID=UPI0037E8AD7F
MNPMLKHWREAATLILAANIRTGNRVLKNNLPQTKGWPQNIDFDYDVLLLKRSQTSSFMPNAFVFPGGLVDPSDFSSEWMEVFAHHKEKPNFGLGLVKQHSTTRAPIFATDRATFGSPIPGEVAFRICAIRETFEESGVLLVVSDIFKPNVNHGLTKMMHFDTKEISTWRLKVQETPAKFIEMCQELNCMPNIWALHEWSNWLTPVSGRTVLSRRYDTAFYICCLADQPYTIDDQKEVTSFKWSTPSEVIENYESQKIWIAPPQYYELSRMARLPSLQELYQFCLDRALEGCERWMPFVVPAEDRYIQILPGDELYPEEPDWTGEKENVLAPDDLLKRSSKMNRVVHWGPYNMIIHANIEQKYKHIHPLIGNLYNHLDCSCKL